MSISTKITRMVLLDALRVIAIALVIFTHIAQSISSPFGSFFGLKDFYFVSLGGVAVTLFIFLSGFVLELNYGQKKYKYQEFVQKRLSYIYPVYWISLIFSIIITCVLKGQQSLISTIQSPILIFQAVTGTYAFFGNWSGPFIGSSWFIGLIVILYLLFPFFSKVSKTRANLLLVITLLISVLSRIILGKHFLELNRALDWFPLSRLFEFYFGMYAAQQDWFLSKLDRLNTFKHASILHLLAELSFPAFLIHFPLLSLFEMMYRSLGFTLALTFYLLLTLSLSYIILLLYKKLFIHKQLQLPS